MAIVVVYLQEYQIFTNARRCHLKILLYHDCCFVTVIWRRISDWAYHFFFIFQQNAIVMWVYAYVRNVDDCRQHQRDIHSYCHHYRQTEKFHYG